MIRELTKDDWVAMEEIIDSRKKFQNLDVDDELHQALKDYVQTRIDREDIIYYGYFVEEKLEAFRLITVLPPHMFVGATWTRAGNTLPKYKDTPWAAALIEIRDHAIIEHKPEFIWRLVPAGSPPDADDNLLFDDYNKNHYGMVPAFSIPEDPFVWNMIFLQRTLPQDQDVYFYSHKRHPVPNLQKFDSNEPHPPRGNGLPNVEAPPIP